MSKLINHGLNNQARDRVEAVTMAKMDGVCHYPCGGARTFTRDVEVNVYRVENLKTVTVEGGHQVELKRYAGPKGETFEEYVQAVRVACDVHVFLALKTDAGPVAESVREEWELGVASACYCRHTC